MIAPTTVIAIIIIVGSLAYGLWTIKNNHNANNSRTNKRRKSDRIKLSSHQKKLYKEAKRHFQKGNIKASAKILESLGMTREAIDLYEKGRFVHEAANILLKINRPNRAGKLYQRHRKWKEATECYKKAHMSFEVAYCAQKAGDNATAAVFFLDCNEKVRAAACFEELGKSREAAKLYIETRKPEKAIKQLSHLLDKTSSIQDLHFSEAETKLISAHLQGPGPDLRFVDIKSLKPHLTYILTTIIKSGETEKAAKLLQRCPEEIHLQLLQRDDLSTKERTTLAIVFEINHQFDFSGMIFERAEDFKRAGQAFKKHEDFERAALCFEKAGLKEDALAMKIEAARTGSPKKAKQPIIEQPVYANADSSQTIDNPFRIEHTENSAVSDESLLKKEESPKPNSKGKTLFPKVSDSAIKKVEDIEKQYWYSFRSSPLLEMLSDREKEVLRSKGEIKEFSDNQLIFADNKRDSAGLFFVLKGSCLSAVGNEPPQEWSESIIPESLFSENLTNRRYIAGEQSIVLVIPFQKITEFLDEKPTCGQKIFNAYVKLKKTDSLSHRYQEENLVAS